MTISFTDPSLPGQLQQGQVHSFCFMDFRYQSLDLAASEQDLGFPSVWVLELKGDHMPRGDSPTWGN